jgi:DNA-directed RNA polymerase specialized sigma24 family protein
VTARRLLSDEVYNAMWLRYVEDMSVNDISAVLERTSSWTKVNLMRGRKALETDMNEDSSRSEAYG